MVAVSSVAVGCLLAVLFTNALNSGDRVVASTGPATPWHFASNGNWDAAGRFAPGAAGFNLADISSASELASLPAKTKALAWVGLCNGVDATFTSRVLPFKSSPKLYGFYLMDDPTPSACKASDLKAEADWIHVNVPGAVTFVLLQNQSSSANPSYRNTYNPANSDVDLYGVDPYPCRSEFNGCNDAWIPQWVQAAETAGVPLANIVPVYQTFGGGTWVDDGGGKYLLPTATQMSQLLTDWEQVVPTPAFDYAYSWGSQRDDKALGFSPQLQTVFLAHNTASPAPTQTTSTTPRAANAPPPATIDFVQAGVASTNAASMSIVLHAVAQGDLLVGYFMQYSAKGAVQVSDNLNGTWTRVLGQRFNHNSGDEALFYVAGAKAGPTTITISAASPTYLQATASEYSGVATTDPLDQAQQAYGYGSVMATSLTAPVNGGELVYAAVTTGASFASVAAGTSDGVGYAVRAENTNTASEDVLSSAQGVQQGELTISNPVDWNGFVATFRPAPPQPGRIPPRSR